MTYDVVYGQGALDRLFGLNLPEVLNCVEAAIERLATHPVHFSMRGRTIYQLNDGRLVRPQEFDFHCDGKPGQSVHFRAHFYYGDDEHTLHVVNLVPTPYSRL